MTDTTTGSGDWADDATEANLARLEALNNQRQQTLDTLRTENQKRVTDLARLGAELNGGVGTSALVMTSTLLELLVETGVLSHTDNQELMLRYENQMAALLDGALTQARASFLVKP